MNRKQRREKAIAKAIYYTMVAVTIMAVIILFAVFGAMVEAMNTSTAQIITVAICSAWIAFYALFIVWIEGLN